MAQTAPADDSTRQTSERDVAAPSVRVVNAVAAKTDADPLTMKPLYDVVDPDALDRLVAAEVAGHVQFVYDGHEVTVHGDGSVVVDGDLAEVR